MKSPLYILTALLPIAAIALPNPDTGGDGGDELDAPLEERGFEERDLEERDRCRFRKSGSYWKYPCFSSERIGSFRSGDRVDFFCKYKDWYRTSRGWVTRDSKPNNCRENDRC
ncbi:hypothetical protein ASPWEDRAFT_44903 [Aspergillus wentii DTO 134E9]|uniref:Uncharacterized protein n=1 Tax=Aspergillus wentii DTO 134E9 TaxID=1073089 RepID=A0A1L9R7Q0_ASPWE|nr:uncharacterized protein ASPWEDRAFT_44903 [Aspergillus wentii DTO 134E9]OJJ30950.1 hypothetical protein ASPWEDRAFT_44903 [Aspergillus wentii DTO 134E9]